MIRIDGNIIVCLVAISWCHRKNVGCHYKPVISNDYIYTTISFMENSFLRRLAKGIYIPFNLMALLWSLCVLRHVRTIKAFSHFLVPPTFKRILIAKCNELSFYISSVHEYLEYIFQTYTYQRFEYFSGIQIIENCMAIKNLQQIINGLSVNHSKILNTSIILEYTLKYFPL